MIKVGIDGRPLEAPKMAGINVYTQEIVHKLINRARIHIYSRSKRGDERLPDHENLQHHVLKLPTYRWRFDQIWETKALPYLSNKSKPDVFWGPRFFVPPNIKCPKVATIHDIAFKLIPGVVDQKQLKYFERLIAHSIMNADHFITVSDTTKHDFCKHYNVNPDKVSTVYNGYSKSFHEKISPENRKNILKRFELNNDFILFLGTLEPRKNLKKLVRAFINSKAFNDNVSLVLAGKIGWENEDFFTEIKPYIKSKQIILTGYVSDIELKALLQSCLFFTFPSQYEGFGIPVLEAMASGAPVLTSNNSAMKELFQGSALLVDSSSVDAISEGINALLVQNERNHFIQKGLNLTQSFSWEKCANEHLEVFQKML